MALVGSELDKIARKSAAEKEAAWVSCGKAPGNEVRERERETSRSKPGLLKALCAFHTGGRI